MRPAFLTEIAIEREKLKELKKRNESLFLKRQKDSHVLSDYS